MSARLVADGATVVGVDRDEEGLAVLAEDLGGLVPVTADVTDEASVLAPYVASKHAVIGLTRSAALQGAAPRHSRQRRGPWAHRHAYGQIPGREAQPDDPWAAIRTRAPTIPMARPALDQTT